MWSQSSCCTPVQQVLHPIAVRCCLLAIRLWWEIAARLCPLSLSLTPLLVTDSSSVSKEGGGGAGELYHRFSRLQHEKRPLLVDTREHFGLRGPGNPCLFKRSEIDKLVGCSTLDKCTFRLIAKRPGQMKAWCCDQRHDEDAPEHEFPEGAADRLKAVWEPAYDKHLEGLQGSDGERAKKRKKA